MSKKVVYIPARGGKKAGGALADYNSLVCTWPDVILFSRS